MDVNTLGVLNQLPFDGFGIGEFPDVRGNGKLFCKLRGSETPRTGNEFKAVFLGRTTTG
jgi:hypothetical protein